MKRVLLFSKWRLTCFCISLFFITPTCHHSKQGDPESLPALFDRPITIPLKTGEGYRINPFYKDSVLTHFPINSLGDTISSGSLYKIRGGMVSPKKGVYPKVVLVGKPITRPAYNNLYLISDNVKVVSINENRIEQFIPSQDSTRLINSVGDTIPSGIARPVIEKKIKYHFNAPVYTTQRMSPRYDAIYNIKILNDDQQLFAANVSALIEDRHGYLWIGMKGGGVARYDGLSLVKFWFLNSFINDLLEDTKGNIWIATNGNGVCRYDGKFITTFTEKNGLASNYINCLLEDKKGNIWFGTRGSGMCCYHPPGENQPGTLTHFSSKEGIHGNSITKILEDKNGNFWLGSNTSGITFWKFPQSENQGTITYLTQKEGLFSNRISDILEDSKGNIWFATAEGACRYDSPNGSVERKLTRFIFRKGHPNPLVTKIIEDQVGNIWFGTYGEGAFQLVRKGSQGNTNELFVQFTKAEGLSHNIISSLLEDKAGNIWLGSAGNGISCLRARRLKHFGENEGLTDFPINAIYEDKIGKVWFGTAGDGMIVYSPAKDDFPGSYTQFTTNSGLPTNFITCITEDNFGNKWLGTADKGLCKFDGKTFTLFTTETGLSGNDISSIIADQNNYLWVGTMTHGLNRLMLEDVVKNQYPVVIQLTEKEGLLNNNIRTIYEDSQNHIWLGSKEGFSRLTFMPKSGEGEIIHFTEKEGLPSHFANSVFESRHGGMWLGTGRGMVYYHTSGDSSPGTLTDYTSINNGYAGIIKSVREDPEENIWMATDVGMNVLIKNQDTIQPYKQLKLYRPDGLKGISFIPNSVLFDQDQQGWWGIESGGAEIINLENFRINTMVPQPKLRGLDINERYLDFRDVPDSLRENIVFDSVPAFENYPLNLKLSHDYNSLAFYFSAIQLTNEHRIGYSFRMKGLNKNWSKISWEPKAEFRSLPYGTYTFQVRAKGEPSQWSDPFEYSFQIRPPWWYSWWAFMLYGLMGCTMMYSTYQFQLSRKLALAEKKRLVELDRVKNRLYTNITHEFRTPLTLIHGPVSQALTYKTSLDQKDMQSIYRQSERLQQLINQMLELQKLESGKLKPQYEYGEIVQIIRYLFNSFEPWAREKNISLIFSSSIQEVHMDLDQEKLTQIITNLVSNAIKHTPLNGKVVLSLNSSSAGDHLLITVQDTGSGISAEDLPYIFDQFYQSKRAARGGTGIGLTLSRNLSELLGGTLSVESTLDIGSAFTLSLPITKHAKKPVQSLPEKINSITEEQDEDILFPTTDKVMSGRPIILIVEDHPEIAQYVASCLGAEYQTLIAFNGNDGVRMAYEHIPDLVISDVMMPGKDGFELTRFLKTDIKTSHIPIILLTGRGDHDALLTGIEFGADAYVTKPFDPTELRLRVKKLLELRANLSQYYRSHSNSIEPEAHLQTSPKENDFMKKVRGIVEEYMNDPQFNMNMLSKEMAMSHPQLHRKITALTGESTGKFVRSVRLTKAVDLLKNSDFTISEIAYETGFSEPGYFSKIFSKEFNMTPSEFREA